MEIVNRPKLRTDERTQAENPSATVTPDVELKCYPLGLVAFTSDRQYTVVPHRNWSPEDWDPFQQATFI